jgi:hypothetical protein
MTLSRKDAPDPFDDIEKPHPTVADELVDGVPTRPLVVRLGDLWSDFLRAPHDSDLADPPRPSSGVPLIDDMKGIHQWD